MKEHKLYSGQLNDGSLDDVIPFLLSKAKESQDIVYVEWNGAVVAIDADSTKESILQDYDDELHKDALFHKEQKGTLISTTELGRKLALMIQDFVNK